jgi:hypothetical protein
MKTQLTDAELWQCMTEADQRRSDRSLPLDARVRSFGTYTACLREASKRGYTYAGLRAAVAFGLCLGLLIGIGL